MKNVLILLFAISFLHCFKNNTKLVDENTLIINEYHQQLKNLDYFYLKNNDTPLTKDEGMVDQYYTAIKAVLTYVQEKNKIILKNKESLQNNLVKIDDNTPTIFHRSEADYERILTTINKQQEEAKSRVKLGIPVSLNRMHHIFFQ